MTTAKGSLREAWEQGIEDSITYLGGSTFRKDQIDVVQNCIALLKSLKENPYFGPAVCNLEWKDEDLCCATCNKVVDWPYNECARDKK